VKVPLAGVFLGAVCGGQAWAEPPAAPQESRRLVILIVVDQCRADYLDRFRTSFRGGFKTLLDRGIRFVEAHHDHAVTVTAPGHAALATGLHPSRSGIIDNQWYDRTSKQGVYSFGDPAAAILRPLSVAVLSPGRSPRNLLGSALGDWLKAHSPASKVFAAGGKDRSAIALGGRKPDGAFWFDLPSGYWVTSTNYFAEYPAWLADFARERHADRYFGKLWEPLAAPNTRTGGGQAFSHLLGWLSLRPNSVFYSDALGSPFLDRDLVDLAKLLVEQQELGVDEAPDLLALGFSALDGAGHDHGPESPEVADVLMRLDAALADLFQFLEGRIGLGQVAIALSADHGVMPLPEAGGDGPSRGERLGADTVLCFQRAGEPWKDVLGGGASLQESLYLDGGGDSSPTPRRQEAESGLAQSLARCPGVERVWTRTELEGRADHDDPFLDLYRHSFHPERSPDLYIQYREDFLPQAGVGTTHGSPYRHDTHVPMVLLLPGVPPREIRARVRTVDLAPTLASWLGVPVPTGLDGEDRWSLFASAPR
jgi:predicted AlkP superfamily pyrophosphatase or phosphodiesterase